jgi:hypothetical protein
MSGAYAAGRVLAEAGACEQRLGCVCRGRDTRAETGMCMQRPECTCKGQDTRAKARTRVLRTYCFYKSNTMYQGILSGLGHGEAKGDLEDEEKAH